MTNPVPKIYSLLFFLGLVACGSEGPQERLENDQLRDTQPAQTAGQQDSGQPNILLIVLDDLGFNDLGANGNQSAPTPQLNAFASQGMRYTRHYADASCSVARAALLTGNYPAKYGFRPTHRGLSPGTPTIASILRDAGYSTTHIGKWHVGNPTLEQSPSVLGFDQWFGFLIQQELGGASEDGVNFKWPQYRNPWLRENDSEARQVTGHLTDILTERAAAFLGAQTAATQPWFLNLWFFAPHAPISPDRRFARNYPTTPEGRYQALLQQLDSSVGRVLSALEESGQAQNTLVVIVSDNGGANKFADSNYPFRGRKTEFFEGGVRTPLLMRWPLKIAPAVSNNIVSLYDILPTLAAAADAELPQQAIGRDLLHQQHLRSPQLFWEYSSSEHFALSVLSVDGRWRYTVGSYLRPELNDLVADPGGATNVVAEHTDVVDTLMQEFVAWRLEQRIVEVDYEALNDRGAARLSGNDVLRSPGYRGFTLALGVTPATVTADAQILVQQADRVQLSLTSDALSIAYLGELITLPALPSGVCSDLIVTSHYAFSPIKPDGNWSVVEVFVNGEKLASRRSDAPLPFGDNLAAATYLGRNSTGGQGFRGVLSRPLILNERVRSAASGGVLGDAVSGVPSLCAGAEAVPPAP